MSHFRIGIVVLTLGFSLTGGLSSCSSSKNTSTVSSVGLPANASGTPVIPGGMTAPKENPSKQPIPVVIGNDLSTIQFTIKGKRYFSAEGTLTPEAFVTSGSIASEREKTMTTLTKALLKEKVFVTYSAPEVGYFKALIPMPTEGESLFKSIESVSFNARFVINPMITSENALKEVRSLSKQMNAEVDASLGNASFSGLQRIHAPEFVKEVQKEIGEVPVDGSSVKVGITDTGITYNHPAYLSAKDKSVRVKYMKEFTGEGTMYFSENAKTTLVEGKSADELLISSEILVTSTLPELPVADVFLPVKDVSIKVSEEQKKILLANVSKVRFAFFDEKLLNSEEDPVDLNRNGKKDDKFPVLVILGDTPETSQLLIDFSGKGDFKSSEFIGDFNTTQKLIQVKSEKIGFHLSTKKLPTSDDNVEVVMSAGIVGYDPGNHGSHVAGIIGGSKTISNDSSDTLARGVAPEAKIMMDRVCSNNAGCGGSEAMIDLAKNGAEVINMSLGGLSPFNDGYSSQDLLVNRLTQLYNTTFVISAGNSGPGRQTIGSPSVARLSLSVGAAAAKSLISKQYQWPASGPSEKAAENDDFMLFFSSRGPTAAGGFKPNVVAPGTELSSVQLNAADGSHAGLDVYWGTSMSAPTTTGAYALLLDGVKKYNEKFPAKKLPTDALTLKEAMIYSAQAFDVSRFDSSTGEKRNGQYTWVDEGLGMIDLVAAWKKLFEIRDHALPTREGDVGVALDYKVITSQVSPYGVKYDGSRPNPKGDALFGTGLLLDYKETSSLFQVNISRKLPENLASKDDGTLTTKLQTSADDFVLKTVYYGSDKEWLKVGVKNQTDCMNSETSPLTVLGTGTEISYDDAGVAKLVQSNPSVLNVCVDRLKIRNELQPGDHGALIFAYKTRNGKEEVMPSFVVPVYITVPHLTLDSSTAYEISKSIHSFGVDRNYISIPEGTSLVKISLEVEKPEAVLDNKGRVASYKNCSGVELMSLEGINTAKSFDGKDAREKARVKSCDKLGNINLEKIALTPIVRANPTPGIWDLNIFGSYIYPNSKYKLRVDYITAISSQKSIVGNLKSLTGSLDFTIKETSIPVSLEKGMSSFELLGLKNITKSIITDKQTIISKGPLGTLRSYPNFVAGVMIQTGGASGSDIDLSVIECADTASSISDPSCAIKGQSGGATDVEKVLFVPKPGFVYAVKVDGYDIKGGVTDFFVAETLVTASEAGDLSTSKKSDSNSFTVNYSFSSDALKNSKLLTSSLFTSKDYSAVGSLTLRNDDQSSLGAVPVLITAE